MKHLARVLAVALVLTMTLGLAGPASAATINRGGTITQLKGTLEDGRRFRGRLENAKFYESRAGNLKVVGRLEGRILNDNGRVVDTVAERVRTHVAVGQRAECPILKLRTGRIFLELLGLQLDIAPIAIDLTAVPGNLLGNLLCAVAGLLDGPGLLSQLIALLNALVSGEL
jgi:hypothetical protein